MLHTFNVNNPNDGSVPFAGLIRDAAGNLYGTTIHGGGTNNAGTLFKLSLVNGSWHEIILHRFAGAASNDAAGPQGSLYLNSGTLYGTSPFGGSVSCVPTGAGCGTVFAFR